MSNLPQWARKPKHKKEVVATSRGWEVKETGEVLKLVKDLNVRLGYLKQEIEEVTEGDTVQASTEVVSESVQTEPESTYQPAETFEPASTEFDTEVSTDDDQQESVTEPEVTEDKPKKRRGRPKKK